LGYQVFISHSGDEAELVSLEAALRRVELIEPYVAEWYQAAGIGLGDKIIFGLDQSRVVLALLTSNSINNEWVNQEIGYARAKQIFIIPVVEDGVAKKGFLDGLQHIRFDRYDFDTTIAEIINRLRTALPRFFFDPQIVNFWIKCPHEGDKYRAVLPSQEAVNAAIKEGIKFSFNHQTCRTTVYVEPKTFGVNPVPESL